MVIRYRADVDASMRVAYRNKYYNILAVLPDAESGREHLTLMTSEGVRLPTSGGVDQPIHIVIDGGQL